MKLLASYSRLMPALKRLSRHGTLITDTDGKIALDDN
jgi:hypothetical protein